MSPWLLAAYLTAFGGDASTTAYALSGHGGQEQVVPSQSPIILTGVIGVEAGLGYFTYRKIKAKHPKLAMTLWIVTTAAHGSATLWNAHQIMKH